LCAARDCQTIRQEIRACIASVNQLREVQFLLAFKELRMHGVLMVVAPLVGKWLTAWSVSVDHRSTGCSCKLAVVHLPHVAVLVCTRVVFDQNCMQCKPLVVHR
jgi:hypothetical protein